MCFGAVQEIDMDTIAHGNIRAKVGVRDVKKIPPSPEITSKELLIFKVEFELESVVEQGWYNDSKRSLNENRGEGLQDDGLRKKTREDGADGEVITLGILSIG